MVNLAVLVLFGWGAVSGGFGTYALMAAFELESLFHAVQAGIALLIATVSISAGFVVIVLGGLKKSMMARGVPPVAELSNETTVPTPQHGAGLHGQSQ